MITPFKGKFYVSWYPKTASTAYAFGDAVTIASTVAGAGTLKKVATTDTRVIGLIQRAVVSTDSDYATTAEVPVLIGDVDAEYLFDVSTGSAATTDIGEMIDLDDQDSVNVGGYTIGHVLVTRVISTTQIVGKFNKGFGKEIPVTV